MSETSDVLADDPLWFKDAIIYEIHSRAFQDSTNDRIGDIAGLIGLISRLDYLSDLGITTIWVLLFYPVLPITAARRRLRHRGLHERPRARRHARRLRAAADRSPQARHSRHHRAGAQPHVVGAPVVSGGPGARRRVHPSATSTSGATRRRRTATRGSSSRTTRPRTGRGTRPRRRTTGLLTVQTSW
jgi:hypothetical protein